jgi:hypothetical protein
LLSVSSGKDHFRGRSAHRAPLTLGALEVDLRERRIDLAQVAGTARSCLMSNPNSISPLLQLSSAVF